MDITSGVFVGRDEEIVILERALQWASAGRLQVCLIQGDPGDGKTTLVENFLTKSKQLNPELTFAVGTCDVSTGTRNYYEPFRDVFGQLTGLRSKNLESLVSPEREFGAINLVRYTIEILREVGPDLVATFLPGASLITKAALSASEKLIQRRAQSSSDSDSVVKHEEVCYQSAAFFAERATPQRPLILVIDDLQWIDHLSLSLLFHLIQHLNSAALLIVLAFRPGDLTSERTEDQIPSSQELISWVRQERECSIVDLRETRATRGKAFISQFLDANGCRVGSEFESEFLKRTNAWPIFAVELLRFLKDCGVLEQNQLGMWKEGIEVSEWRSLPTRLIKPDALIEARLNQLPHQENEILRVASIEGFEFTAQVISLVSSVNEKDLLRTLSSELGRKHGLVVELNEERIGTTMLSRYRFANIWYQEHIYQSMGLGEKRVLHGEVARALESLLGEASPTAAINLSHHYELGNDLCKASQYLIETGCQQAANAEYADALRSLTHGLALAREINHVVGVVDALRFIAVNVHLARGVGSDFAIAENLLGECIELCRKESLLRPLAFALRGQGRLYRQDGRYTEAVFNYMEGLNIAQQLDDQEEVAKFYTNLGVVASAEKRYKDALFYYRRRLAIANDLDSDEGRIFGWMNVASVLCSMVQQGDGLGARDLAEAQESIDAARRAVEKRKDPNKAVGIEVIQARIYLLQGHFDKTARTILACLSAAQLRGFGGRLRDGLEVVARMLLRWAPREPLLFEITGLLSVEGSASQKSDVRKIEESVVSVLSPEEATVLKQARELRGKAELDAVTRDAIAYLTRISAAADGQ
ncbi:MAG: AAA family ATPase [Caldilineaceae bacterium]